MCGIIHVSASIDPLHGKSLTIFDRIHFHAKSIILHTTSDGFGFNINDICMNPHNVSYRFLHGISVNITTAKSDNGRWDYGILIKFKSCEYSRLVCYVDNEMKGYQNESSAIHSALNEADWFFRRKFNKYPNLLRAVLNRIVKLKSIYEPRQLSIF